MHKVPKSLHQPSEVQPIRCAIYARYSDDLQRRSSIEDQIRQCREAAERNGWTVLDQYIKSDEAKTGQVLLGRPGLEELVRLASVKPRPFDCILIDDTSRFGRNLSDTLPLTDQLKFAGVFLYFVSVCLDQRDPNFRTLYISYGQQDERFSKALAEKVFRGQVGRVRAGYIASGKTYGYRNIPIESTTRIGTYGRPMIDAVTLEIIPEQAAVVRRIFEMYVGGLGAFLIAKTLNREGILPTSVGHTRSRNVGTRRQSETFFGTKNTME
jgi:site-specific DNA recombinase